MAVEDDKIKTLRATDGRVDGWTNGIEGGEGQRPFGTFLKIHPFWKGSASLTVGCDISRWRWVEVKCKKFFTHP